MKTNVTSLPIKGKSRRTECPPRVCVKGGGLPRGLRNCNPLNIRHSKSRWKGMARDQTDPAFVRFTTMAYGYRAAFCLLRTYRVKYGYNTLRKIIKRWAPPSENNTERYIQNVSQWTGIDPDKILTCQDANAMIQIVAAMSRMENGIPANLEEVSQGYRMI